MSVLYAINQDTGNNEPVANLSDEDSAKIGRGYEIGHLFGTVTDQDTGAQYQVMQATCGGDNCNCAVTVQKVEA